MTYHFLESLYKDLVSIISGITIKRQDLARASETTESLKAFERYLACINGTAYFYTFSAFNVDILKKYFSSADAVTFSTQPDLIPEAERDAIVRDQIAYELDHYEEKNEYYRMLMGLPPTNDHRWVYVRDQEDIPPNVPIHKMTVEQISALEIRGVLPRLQKNNPDKKYLNYLGIHSIDIITSRLAKPFEILQMGPSSNPRVIEMFEEQYYGARRYILATAYNRAEMTDKDLYDPVVGVLMLTLAVRNTMVPSEYDYLNFEEILDAILESYGFLKYFQRFPYTYKRRLVLAMDRLLMVKGTDGVLVDVCKLFSPDDLIANRYFLLKYQTKDVDGNVMFTGDREQDYTMEFVKANIESRDIDLQEENRVSYNTVTDNDYLWQLTPQEKQEVLGQDFNLVITKYVDIEAAYETTYLVFEVCCFINMLLYARNNTSKINVQNIYATGGTCTLFTMLNFLLAAMAKRSNYDGNIVYDPAGIAEIWRFNYGEISDTIREIANKYELRIDVDRTLVEGFDLELDKPEGLTTNLKLLEVYANNRALYNAICKEMRDTKDIDHYIALSNCKDTLFTSCTERKTFMKLDGSHASTYYEMLKDLDPKLARKIDSIEPEDEDALNNLLVYILEQLQNMFDNGTLKYLFLNSPTIYSMLLGRYIRTAINVFKAHLIQLRSINVAFRMGDLDPIKVIDGAAFSRVLANDEVIHVEDSVSIHRRVTIDEYVAVGDKVYTNMNKDEEVIT